MEKKTKTVFVLTFPKNVIPPNFYLGKKAYKTKKEDNGGKDIFWFRDMKSPIELDKGDYIGGIAKQYSVFFTCHERMKSAIYADFTISTKTVEIQEETTFEGEPI